MKTRFTGFNSKNTFSKII